MDEIIISKDKLFKLIKELETARDNIKTSSEKDILRKHRLKVEIQCFNRLLEHEGIDNKLTALINENEKSVLINNLRGG